MATRTDDGASRGNGTGPFAVVEALDRGVYALFAGRADRSRHDRDRKRYRAADLRVGFDRYLARVYALSWLVGLWVGALVAVGGLAVPADLLAAAASVAHEGLPLVERLSMPDLPRTAVALVLGLLAGALAKRGTVHLAGTYLRWVASARQAAIERTLPGAVRYLRALATGSDDGRTLLRQVAEADAYGETSAAFRRVLNRAALTGSLDEGLRRVARDTPSRETLAPFLLKFREHADQGADALSQYLEMESRMLSHQQARARQRAEDFLELVAELFVVLLVLPALLVVVVTVLAVLAPGLSAPMATPLGTTTPRALLAYGSAGFVLLVGAGATMLVASLQPPSAAPPSHERPGGLGTLLTALRTPASAAAVFLAPAVAVLGAALSLGYPIPRACLLGYVAYGLPVGLVAVRRARLDDAKDREIQDFVHAVAGRVTLGRPFADAVAAVARETDLGALSDDVDDLAYRLDLAEAPVRGESAEREAAADSRTAALDAFVDSVGTPLAEQTIGLVTGALELGGDPEAAFETLQTEVGRLRHERKALRSSMMVYVAVGWTTALLVVGIVLAVHGHVLDGFAQLSAVQDAGGSAAATALDPDAVDRARDGRRFYWVAQATMLACGWFAGTAARDRYEALLHSASLALVCHVAFAAAGVV
ncbi:type II secretion system F family protein [Haloglomus halophilum]|uniref:type II secretion system F family protein n=1 Tax=Haloglomus halophilum TaxID=2962672 RepID=UPI0020C9E322|nr:type II secretion system F family protein [Haloglomus halophilum]